MLRAGDINGIKKIGSPFFKELPRKNKYINKDDTPKGVGISVEGKSHSSRRHGFEVQRKPEIGPGEE